MKHGVIAQLVARLNGIQKVRGSTPLSSTIFVVRKSYNRQKAQDIAYLVLFCYYIAPLQIGNYTPYEVMLLAKQKRERETRQFEYNITLAWHMEAFAMQKK